MGGTLWNWHNLVTMVPSGYAHGGGIATNSIYKYTMLLYLALYLIWKHINSKRRVLLTCKLRNWDGIALPGYAPCGNTYSDCGLQTSARIRDWAKFMCTSIRQFKLTNTIFNHYKLVYLGNLYRGDVGPMSHFYISGHKSQSLASKAPKFSMNNNHLSLNPHAKNQ